MPVTIRTCNFKAETWTPPSSVKLTSDPLEILEAVDPLEAAKCDQVWACSTTATQPAEPIAASANGLIHAVIEAWNNHYNLILRPDDFWFAIVSQLSFYINANAEALRSHFVAHQGKKQLIVEQEGTIHTVDYALFADDMADEIGKNVKDPKLKDWILPDFSTTTPEDRTVAAVLFMGAMQKYFEYFFDCCTCAIPEITLLGERDDWVKLQGRLPQLLEWGDEAKKYHRFLVPIFKHIVASFDDPTSAPVVDFWKTMVSPHGPDHDSGAKPTPYVTGWISGLFLWYHTGKVRDDVQLDEQLRPSFPRDESAMLDGVYYPRMHLEGELIPAVASVPVMVREKEDGVIAKTYDTRMVAGIGGFKPCEMPTKPPGPESEDKPGDSRRGSLVTCTGLLRQLTRRLRGGAAKAGGHAGEKGGDRNTSDGEKSKEASKSGKENELESPPRHQVDLRHRALRPLRLGPGLNTVKLEAFWLIYLTKEQNKPANV